MTTFDIASWERAAESIAGLHGSLIGPTGDRLMDTAISHVTSSACDQAAHKGVYRVNTEIAKLLVSVRTRVDADEGRMRTTAANYRAADERAQWVAGRVGRG